MYKNTFFAASTALVTVLLITSVLGDVTNMYGKIFVKEKSLFAKQDTITICHVPDDPDVTMKLNEHALNGHLKHNDYLGPCQSQSSSSSSSAAEENIAESVHAAPSHTAFGLHRGRSLSEHAAVIHSVFSLYGLHKSSSYDFTLNHENIHPESFASEEEAQSWTLQEHAACCSIFRYLQRLREARPSLHTGYVDWITKQVAHALDEDPVEIKAALLGLPHAHPHVSNLIRSITEAGCIANPYVPGKMKAAHITHKEPENQHAAAEKDETSSLIIQQNDIADEISFSVMDGEEVFTTYGISHTKELHLLIVRDDLRHFHHLHPTRDTNGVWHVPFIPPAGGTYWIYADFIDQEGTVHTLRFQRTYDGDPSVRGLEKVPGTKKTLGQLRITFEVERYPHGSLFTYHIRDAYGNAPYLQQYLGSMGHGVLISPKGDMIHTHPSPAGDALVFHIPDPPDDFYRAFTQIQIAGEVMTMEFDWEPH